MWGREHSDLVPDHLDLDSVPPGPSSPFDSEVIKRILENGNTATLLGPKNNL